MDKKEMVETTKHCLKEVKDWANRAAKKMDRLGDRDGARTARKWADEADKTGPNKREPTPEDK